MASTVSGQRGVLFGRNGITSLENFGALIRVGNLTTNQDRDTVTIRVSQRHGRTHGVAVTAEHTPLIVNLNGLDLFTVNLDLCRFNSAQRTGGDSQRQLADTGDTTVIDHRRLTMHTKDGDIGGMNGTAHVQTAGQGDTALGRQGHGGEVVEQLIHNGLDHTGGIRCRGVAMNPTLGMDDIGHTGSGSTNGELIAATLQIVQQRLNLGLGIDHELYVVPGGEAQETIAMFIGDVTDLTDKLMLTSGAHHRHERYKPLHRSRIYASGHRAE